MNTEELTYDLAHATAALVDGLGDVIWALSVLTAAPEAAKLLRRAERLGADLRRLASEINLWPTNTDRDSIRSGAVYAMRGMGKLAAHMREAAEIAAELGGENSPQLVGLLDQAYSQAWILEEIILRKGR